MINTARDNLPHIRSKQQRESITEAQARMWTHSESTQLTRQVGWEVTGLINFKNVKSYYQEFLDILGAQILYFNKNPIGGHIIPIMNSLENNILRVKRGMYFRFDGRYYEVTGAPLFDGGMVVAYEVFPEYSNSFPRTHYFKPDEVLSTMVSFEEVVWIMLDKAGLNKKSSANIDEIWRMYTEQRDQIAQVHPKGKFKINT